MENPRIINRFLFGLLAVYAVIAIAGSIFFGDVSILLYSMVATALIFVMFGFVAALNVILYSSYLLADGKVHCPQAKGGRGVGVGVGS